MFAETARELGYHPFPRPSSNCSRPYTNIEGLTLGACQLCGYCDRNGCEANAKAGPHVCVLPRLHEDEMDQTHTRSPIRLHTHNNSSYPTQRNQSEAFIIGQH